MDEVNQRPLTLAESRVRLSFNPSSNLLVDEIKRTAASFIDICHLRSQQAKSGEEARLWALAMTHIEDAAMWAVKAATA